MKPKRNATGVKIENLKKIVDIPGVPVYDEGATHSKGHMDRARRTLCHVFFDMVKSRRNCRNCNLLNHMKLYNLAIGVDLLFLRRSLDSSAA